MTGPGGALEQLGGVTATPTPFSRPLPVWSPVVSNLSSLGASWCLDSATSLRWAGGGSKPPISLLIVTLIRASQLLSDPDSVLNTADRGSWTSSRRWLPRDLAGDWESQISSKIGSSFQPIAPSGTHVLPLTVTLRSFGHVCFPRCKVAAARASLVVEACRLCRSR